MVNLIKIYFLLKLWLKLLFNQKYVNRFLVKIVVKMDVVYKITQKDTNSFLILHCIIHKLEKQQPEKKNTGFFIPSNLLHCYHKHNLYVNASSFHVFVNVEPHRLKYPQEQI